MKFRMGKDALFSNNGTHTLTIVAVAVFVVPEFAAREDVCTNIHIFIVFIIQINSLPS